MKKSNQNKGLQVLLRDSGQSGFISEKEGAERGWNVGDDVLLKNTSFGRDIKVTVLPDGLFDLYARAKRYRVKLKPMPQADA